MASRLTIPKITPRDVDRHLRSHSCGLRLARAEVRREKLIEAIDKVETIADAKIVLKALAKESMLRL